MTSTDGGDHGHGPNGGDDDHADEDHAEQGHAHSHTTLDAELASHAAAVRAIWISVVGLGLTAAFQLGIVAISGSAGLFADATAVVGWSPRSLRPRFTRIGAAMKIEE